jgi:hypothetical protein
MKMENNKGEKKKVINKYIYCLDNNEQQQVITMQAAVDCLDTNNIILSRPGLTFSCVVYMYWCGGMN